MRGTVAKRLRKQMLVDELGMLDKNEYRRLKRKYLQRKRYGMASG